MQVAGLVHDLGKLLYFFGSESVFSIPSCSDYAERLTL